MSFDENSVGFVDDSNGNDLNCTNRRGGIGEKGFALGELEPEVVDLFCAGFDAPGGERVRGNLGLSQSERDCGLVKL